MSMYFKSWPQMSPKYTNGAHGYINELKSLPIELMHYVPLVLQIAFLFCIWIISMIIIEIRCRFGLDPIPCKRKFIGSIMTSYQACACHVHGGTMGVPLSTFFLYLSSTTENTFCFFFYYLFLDNKKTTNLIIIWSYLLKYS